ncbi:hypothetical protein B296_00029614 [Ensete ventricosum]|uniref:Uncharacterized protein n=1 Tax=Ensete ventricosum TaxID=4639 RepID=A0A426ZJY3_ENSVE|nr:hypothetical protein B296_00029614 [Ensete ventricosum]
MKSGSRTGSGSAAPSTTSAFVAVGVAVLVAEKRPSADEGASLRKRSRKAAPEQPTDASESTTKAPAKKRREPVGKGKEPTEVEEVPEQGYSIKDLCEVEDWAGADGYFASIMKQLKTNEGEDPLTSWWSSISGSTRVWTEGPLAGEYLRGALHPTLAKQLYECSSEELL